MTTNENLEIKTDCLRVHKYGVKQFRIVDGQLVSPFMKRFVVIDASGEGYHFDTQAQADDFVKFLTN